MTWRHVALGEIATIVSGATPKTGVPEYWDGTVPWATPKDLSNHSGKVISSTPRRITEAGLKSCAATVLPAGSVLLSSRAPIGHVGINGVPMATNQGFKSLVPDPRVLDANYLYHWLRANRPLLESLGNGATFKEISKATVERVEVPLPSIDEQRRISAILDQAASLTALSADAVSSTTAAVQALFQAMFGTLEAEMASGASPKFQDAVRALEGGRNLVGPDADEATPYRVLRISAVTSGTFKADESKPLPSDYVPDPKHLVRTGDLLISRANTTAMVGATALVGKVPDTSHFLTSSGEWCGAIQARSTRSTRWPCFRAQRSGAN